MAVPSAVNPDHMALIAIVSRVVTAAVAHAAVVKSKPVSRAYTTLVYPELPSARARLCFFTVVIVPSDQPLRDRVRYEYLHEHTCYLIAFPAYNRVNNNSDFQSLIKYFIILRRKKPIGTNIRYKRSIIFYCRRGGGPANAMTAVRVVLQTVQSPVYRHRRRRREDRPPTQTRR